MWAELLLLERTQRRKKYEGPRLLAIREVEDKMRLGGEVVSGGSLRMMRLRQEVVVKAGKEQQVVDVGAGKPDHQAQSLRRRVHHQEDQVEGE